MPEFLKTSRRRSLATVWLLCAVVTGLCLAYAQAAVRVGGDLAAPLGVLLLTWLVAVISVASLHRRIGRLHGALGADLDELHALALSLGQGDINDVLCLAPVAEGTVAHALREAHTRALRFVGEMRAAIDALASAHAVLVESAALLQVRAVQQASSAGRLVSSAIPSRRT